MARLRINIDNTHIILLYVMVMFIITFLQQEFVLIPELQNLDVVGEDSKAKMMEQYQKWRWLSFAVIPILLLIRLGLVSLCFFIGSFFFPDMNGKGYKDWWSISVKAQSIMIIYSIILCVANVVAGANMAAESSKYSSLLFLAGEDIEQWLKVPLSAVNIFEIIYWLVMAKLVSKMTGSKFGLSFNYVMSSYGVGYLFYIIFLMFLLLYLS